MATTPTTPDGAAAAAPSSTPLPAAAAAVERGAAAPTATAPTVAAAAAAVEGVAPAAAAVERAAAAATSPPPPPPPKRPFPRSLIFLGATVGIVTALTLWDNYRLKREKALLVGEAKKLADVPMPEGGEARQVIIIRPAGRIAKHQFVSYVKPVLDAAALDYVVKEAEDAEAAVGLARDLSLERTRGAPADGVVVLGTQVLRGVLEGVRQRLEKDPSQTYTLGYIPMRDTHFFARTVNFYNEATSFRKMGEYALGVVEGYRRPLTQDDIDEAEVKAEDWFMRRKVEGKPLMHVHVEQITQPIQLFALAPERVDWRAQAEQRLDAASPAVATVEDQQVIMPSDEDAEQHLAEMASKEAAKPAKTFAEMMKDATFKR